jgi:Tfp pilus assembly protein PilF
VAREIEVNLNTFARMMLNGDARAARGLRELATRFGELRSGYRALRTASFRLIRIELDGPTAHATVIGEIAGEDRRGGRRQDHCRCETAWMRQNSAWSAGQLTSFQCAQQRGDKPMFQEVTAAALGADSALRLQFGLGINYWAERLDAASGIDFYGLNGVAAADFDGDGWDDFYVCQPGGLPGRLFRNRGDGAFEDVTIAVGLGLLDATAAALFGDFDNDGDPDLFLVTAGGILLFESDGRGRFTRSTRARFDVPPNEQGSLMMPALADYDRDGFLDLYVCSYSLRSGSSMAKYLLQPAPYFDADNGAPNHLFRNNGNGTFTDVTARTGLSANNTRWSFAASWSDYNRDGFPDLYVANDFGRNNLYRNDGDGTFTDVAARAGVEDIGAGMSVAWGDFDNDGFDDLYVANIWSAAGQRAMALPEFQAAASPALLESMRRFAQGNSLYRNRGDGTFERAGNESANGGWAWGSDFLDADNDGWEDLLTVNGQITNDREDDLEAFHWTNVVGASPLQPIRSRAYEDAWRLFQRLMNDGWSIHGKERDRFFRNTGAGGFVDFSAPSGLDFDGDGRAFAALDYDNDSDLDLVLKSRTAPQVRVLRNDSPSANHAVAVELVGRKSNRDAVGARVTFTLDGKIRTKEVRAGSGFLSQHTRRLYFGVGPARELPALRIDWPSGLVQEIQRIPAGAVIHVEEGRPGFVARPFRRPQPASAGAQPLTAATNLQRGAWLLSPVRIPNFELKDRTGKTIRLLEELHGRPAALTIEDASRIVLLPAAGGAGAAYLATPAAIRLLKTVVSNLFARRRPAVLPLALLLDSDGQLAKIYRGTVSHEQLAEDVRELPAYRRDRLRKALPFPWRYSGPLGNRLETWFLIGLECLQAGLHDDALAYFNQCLRLDSGLAPVHSNIASIHARQGRLDEALTIFRRASSLDPQSADIQFNIGTTLAMAGRYGEASAALEQAARMDPGSAETWTNLGNVYMDLEQPALARSPFERALALNPGSAVVHNSLGTLYHQQRMLDRARQHFEEAIRLQPDYDSAYVNLGLLYLSRQDRAQAAGMFRRAVEVNPANGEARRLLERTQ